MSAHTKLSAMPRIRAPWLVLVSLLATSGCSSTGPHWKNDFLVPAPAAPSNGQEMIVVADFHVTAREGSITQSGNIRTLLEEAYVHDASAEIAAGLRARGIPAEARVGSRRLELAEGELLLRGSIRSTDSYDELGKATANFTLFVASVCVIGGILPSPLHWTSGRYVDYRLELVDAEGRPILHVPETRTAAIYRSRYLWGIGAHIPETMSGAKALLVEAIAESLADWLRRGEASEPDLESDSRRTPSVRVTTLRE